MNIVYAGASYPLGALSDRIARHHLLTGGSVVLIIADLLLAHGTSPASRSGGSTWR